jgi:hypothetical protein
MYQHVRTHSLTGHRLVQITLREPTNVYYVHTYGGTHAGNCALGAFMHWKFTHPRRSINLLSSRHIFAAPEPIFGQSRVHAEWREIITSRQLTFGCANNVDRVRWMQIRPHYA